MPSGTKCLRCVFGTACGLSSFVSPSASSGRRRAHTSNPAKNGETTSANMNQLIPSRPRLLATTPTINANATQKGIIQNKKFPHFIPQEILRPEDQPLQVPYGASNSSASWRMPFGRAGRAYVSSGNAERCDLPTHNAGNARAYRIGNQSTRRTPQHSACRASQTDPSQ